MGALTHCVCFLFSLRELLMFWPSVLVWYFGGMIVLVVSRLAGDRPMSPLFQRVHGPPCCQLSITSVLFKRLLSVRLGRFMECSGVLPITQFAYRKSMGTCDALFLLVLIVLINND